MGIMAGGVQMRPSGSTDFIVETIGSNQPRLARLVSVALAAGLHLHALTQNQPPTDRRTDGPTAASTANDCVPLTQCIALENGGECNWTETFFRLP